MTDEDEAARQAEQKAREQREANEISYRILQLHDKPIEGRFDAEHLKAIHAHIFQDYPEHQPGVVREDTSGWIKTRELEGGYDRYVVHYEHHNIEDKITGILDQFGGAEAIKGSTPEVAAGKLAELYGDLDHAHGFYEGNSRTLREFTRELAKEAGFNLDWTGTTVGEQQRNELYIARDLAVLERAFPDLTIEKVMQTDNRFDYETSFRALSTIEALKNDVGERPLEAIIRDGLSPDIQLEQGQERAPDPFDRAEGVAAAPAAERIEEPRQTEAQTGQAAEAVADPLAAEIGAAANAVEHVATAAFDKIADIAGDAIETIASAFESLFGGGPSAPEPKAEPPRVLTPKEARDARIAAFLVDEQQQRESRRQEMAKSLGASPAMTEEELQREQMAQQKNSRDQGGGISR